MIVVKVGGGVGIDYAELCADIVKRPIDLVERVRAGRETDGLTDYAEDVALIVAAEMAQLRLLDEFFGIKLTQAKLALGYSLGECTALMATGVFSMTDLLRVPLSLADDCAALAAHVTLAVLISRGPVLDFDEVRRLCLEVSQEETIDQLQVLQDQLQTVRRALAAQQADTKQLSERVSGLTEAVEGLRQSFASARANESAPAPSTRNRSIRTRAHAAINVRHRKLAKSRS